MGRRPWCWMLSFVLVANELARSVPKEDPVAVLDAYASAARSDWEIPGLALAVVKHGEVVLSKGYGVRELGKEDRVDENTLFAIGSTTKAMTVATLGVLFDEGKLEWDQPVIRYLPEFRLKDPYVTQEATVRDLLTHRTGLGNADYLWYGGDPPREQVLAQVDRIEAAHSFRGAFEYQNVMYVAAGELAARVSGSTWEDLLRQRLFAPLGMIRSTANTSAAQQIDNVARPHARIEEKVRPIDNHPLDGVAPAGGVWSGAREMSRWVLMLLSEGQYEGRTILSPEVVAEMLRPQELLRIANVYPYAEWLGSRWQAYGLGWFQVDYHGRFVCFHTGSIDGMAAIVGIVPEEDLGVVVLQNLQGANLRHALLWKCIDLFGGDFDGRDWSREMRELFGQLEEKGRQAEEEFRRHRRLDTHPTLPLGSYEGLYENSVYGSARVTSKDGRLRLELAPLLTADLEQWHYDTFLARFDRRWQDDLRITFHLDAEGAASTMLISDRTFRRAKQE